MATSVFMENACANDIRSGTYQFHSPLQFTIQDFHSTQFLSYSCRTTIRNRIEFSETHFLQRRFHFRNEKYRNSESR